MEVVSYNLIKKRLSKEAMSSFDEFIKGQTCGKGDKGDSLIYHYDFLRWWRSWEWL